MGAFFSHRRAFAVAAVAFVALLALTASFAPASDSAAASVYYPVGFSSASSTTIACTIATFKYDFIVLGITTNVALSSVNDGGSNTWTSVIGRGGATNATNIGNYAYIYEAEVLSATGSDTVTATFSSAAISSLTCVEVSGILAPAAKTSSGAGSAVNRTMSQTLTVGSYSPTTGDFVVSAAAGYFCGGSGSSIGGFTTVTTVTASTFESGV